MCNVVSHVQASRLVSTGPRICGAGRIGPLACRWEGSVTMLKVISVVSFLLMIAGLLGLIATHSLLSRAPVVIAAQVGAFALMVWARVTFGLRSFHAAADPTGGGLVTTGPYRFVRHPIYTAVCLFAVAGALAHVSLVSLGLALLVLLGAIGRMMCEELLLLQRYPEYADYAAKTKRMLPFVF